MSPSSVVLTEPLAGLRAQALGLAEAAGWQPTLRDLCAREPWRRLPPAWWPWPLAAVTAEALAQPWPDVLVGCGGKSAAVLAGLRRLFARPARVIVQHPRMDPRRFDVVIAARHDRLSGPNVVVTRTALHRVTQARLNDAADAWRDRLGHLPRPLLAVLVGGSNGRYQLGPAEGARLAQQLAQTMRCDKVGLALTPSRRTDATVSAHLAATLGPLGAWVWDGIGENPYFGLLGLADAIVVTADSVSMVSEAAATTAPLLLARLPGHSRRIELFLRGLLDDGRARDFQGRLELWPTARLDDTAMAAHEMRRRLGL